MAGKSRPTFNKNNIERAKREKRREKMQRKLERRQEARDRKNGEGMDMDVENPEDPGVDREPDREQ